MNAPLVTQSGFFNRRPLAAQLICWVAVLVALYAFGVFPAASSFSRDPSSNENADCSSANQGRAIEYGARIGDVPSEFTPDLIDSSASDENRSQNGIALPRVIMAPTRSTFLASWNGVTGATGYRLDVSTSSLFASYVKGYQGLDVGNITGRIVSGLRPGTTYYYRVRVSSARGVIIDSDRFSATTATNSGLVIIPTFDSTILNNSNSAAIQSTINQAIAIYQALFSDPITVKILFRYSNRQPNGSLLRSSSIAVVQFTAHDAPWDTYINALKTDARTGNDATANASLPTSPLSTQVLFSSANGRALGFDTPGTMDATGTDGAGTFDGIATLNSNKPFQFTRPTNASSYDALRLTQGCISGVLGVGSGLDVGGSSLLPQDLFSWAGPSVRNITASGSRYLSINGGNTKIVDFNQDSSQSFSLWLSPPCPQANPYVNTAVPCLGQSADVTATSPEGIDLDIIGYDPPPSTLANISTRLRVETGDNVLIGGFIVLSGSQPKKIIVRAIGPSLPLGGRLADPVLELRDSSGGLVASNDDWRSNQEAEIMATTIPPSNDLESAIVATLPANNSGYTAIVRGKNNGTGIGVVEAYDLDTASNSKLANISTRGLVQTGDNVLIAGTIVVGTVSGKVLFRAIGPSLTTAGVPNALQDPTLELHDGNGGIIAVNDNWRDTQEAAITATGIPPSDNRESAILANLPPGAYTAIVRGQNNSTGVAIVEAYQLQ